MPKVSGVFNLFDHLTDIPMEDIARWIKNPPAPSTLENYLANKAYYPQTVPATEASLKIDLAILREALKNTPTVTPQSSNKIVIPVEFLDRFPDLWELTRIFIETKILAKQKYGIKENIWTIVLKKDLLDKTLGSLIRFRIDKQETVAFTLAGKHFSVQPEELKLIPCLESRVILEFSVEKGKLLGQDSGQVELAGGKLGIVIDTRSL